VLASDKRKAVRNSLELRLRRCKGTGLQEFLALVMAKLHGENFVAAGTDYSRGDLQCDGLLQDPLTIFACYGPVNAGAHQTEASMVKAVAKVASDYEGAYKHWPDLKEWVFVTNYLDTPAQITQELLRLKSTVTGRKLRIYGRPQFESDILGLGEADIEDLLGNDATEVAFRSIQPQEVLDVVKAVMATASASRLDDGMPIVVPFEKLEFNGLEEIYKDRIAAGFKNAPVVQKLVRDHPNPLLEGDLAAVYKAKYLELTSQAMQPGEVMDELYAFTLAENRPTTPREVAVWSLLAYMFERCTIFKDKPVTGTPIEEAA
jgi:hypothetical protein